MKLFSRSTNKLNATGRISAVIVPLMLACMSVFSLSDGSAVAQEREAAGPAEKEAGPRRSIEGKAGPKRPAEGEAGKRRSAEGESGAGRSAEGAGRGNALKGFKPQTPREAALLQMVLLLQQEVAALRREVQASRSTAKAVTTSSDNGSPRASKPRGDTFVLPERWQNTKDGKVFKAYDKNGDFVVTLDEFLAMTNGNVNAVRRAVQTKRFNEAEPSGDGKFTPTEFIYWYSIGRHKAVEKTRRGSGATDSAGPGGGNGESRRRGARDGERTRNGSRDG